MIPPIGAEGKAVAGFQSYPQGPRGHPCACCGRSKILARRFDIGGFFHQGFAYVNGDEIDSAGLHSSERPEDAGSSQGGLAADAEPPSRIVDGRV